VAASGVGALTKHKTLPVPSFCQYFRYCAPCSLLDCEVTLMSTGGGGVRQALYPVCMSTWSGMVVGPPSRSKLLPRYDASPTLTRQHSQPYSQHVHVGGSGAYAVVARVAVAEPCP
jgi:hypothetical protein